MAKPYNAEQEQQQGRLTHGNFRTKASMNFGPGRDREGLSDAAVGILNMAKLAVDGKSGGPVLERTKAGGHFRMTSKFAELMGIEREHTTDHSPRCDATVLAAVHETLTGIVEYVDGSELPPDQIVPDVAERLGLEPEPEPAAQAA